MSGTGADSGSPARALRTVVLGQGSIGRRTADVLAGLDRVEVAATIPARAFDPADLATHRADVVAVCSASGLHVPHARAALAAGCHVVVEKPLTLDIPAGRDLLDAADAAGRSLAVISQRRWEPSVLAARSAIASGVLGRPLLVEALLHWNRDDAYYAASPWRGTRDLDGGVLFNQAIHLLDLARWLVGPVASVNARDATRVRAIEAPDTVAATLEFASGALGVVSASVASDTNLTADLALHFEHGTIGLADADVRVWEVPGVPRPADEVAGKTTGHRRQWASIVAALHSGRPPEVTGPDALGSAALVAAIHASADAGGRPTTPAVP